MSSCSFDGSKKTTTAPVPKEEKLKLQLTSLSEKNDLVCGMELTNETLEDTAAYARKIYGFCNVGCKEEFLKDPSKYISQK